MLSKYNSVATERYLYTYTVFNGLLEGHAIMFWKCISMEIAGESMCLLYKHKTILYLEKMKTIWLDLFHFLKPKLDLTSMLKIY